MTSELKRGGDEGWHNKTRRNVPIHVHIVAAKVEGNEHLEEGCIGGVAGG